ncbi:flagellar hook-basal body complex protein [Telmatospirillum siberiense]|uniref:Flagellar hook protein FlgE n=1 Tax=Telmatospirillum siberiense TaxID=382514 RepID=A0A2N3Q021_9PROT|nr:flagellar hook-basal body complex protein [Telmatospirillum siberiense]PKU26004.1 hypothetical protein CWS72_02345 [Telmatospirillum siberiense]
MDAAMSSAVSGLLAESTALSNISNNLSNSQTTGYKSVSTTFTSLLTELTNSSTYTSGGVSASARQNVLAQGTITSTSVTTDMAISGAGLFAVTTSLTAGQTYYTRNGAFDTDSTGNLYLSGTNYYLEGYSVNSGTASSSLSVVNIESREIDPPVATSTYSLSANFPAAAQNDLGTISYTTTSTPSTTEHLSAVYVQTGSDSAAGTTTYEVAIDAANGTTITDGTGTSGSQLLYSVTVDSAGAITAVVDMATNTTTTTLPDITPSDASTISLSTNYTSWSSFATAVGTGFSQTKSMTIYDSLGVSHAVSVTYTAAGDNKWLMTVKSASDGTLVDSNGSSVSSYSYEVSFNSDGTYSGITSLGTGETNAGGTAGSAPISSTGGPEISAIWTDGAAPTTGTSAVSMFIGSSGKSDGLSQYSSSSSTAVSITVNSYSQDGVREGTLSSVAVSSAGDVVASYTNGNSVTIYKIPVVTFANENGLTAMSDGVYSESLSSGGAVFNTAGEGASGTIEGGALESSTVNTTTEFANMITTQQAYSAASQVISTDKQMFTSLMQAIA